MYKVVKYFTDLLDNNHPYNVGDIFPRKGLEATEERFAELAGDKNKQGVPLIELAINKPEAEAEVPKRKATKKTAAEK